MMRRSRYSGSPNIAVFTSAGESLAITAIGTQPDFVGTLSEVLDVEVVRMSVAGSTVVGSLVALNSSGVVLSGLADDDEVSNIPNDINCLRLDDPLNAAGNNILVNDNGAIVNPEYSESVAKVIEDVLGVETVRSSIAGINTVGSICRATNKGCACHIDASDEDVALLQDVLKVEVVRTTVNHGSRAVGAGILANSKGAIVGDDTTPIEMGRIEEALNLY